MAVYGTRGLATREFYDRLAEEASVPGGPNIIRYTVRTCLDKGGVPDAEADVFMGHKPEGSATGKRYIHRRPEYRFCNFLNLERETRLELATPTLARSCSTN